MVESLTKELIQDLQWDYDKGTQGGGDDAKIGSLGPRTAIVQAQLNNSFVVIIKEHPLIRVFFYIHSVTKVYNL